MRSSFISSRSSGKIGTRRFRKNCGSALFSSSFLRRFFADFTIFAALRALHDLEEVVRDALGVRHIVSFSSKSHSESWRHSPGSVGVFIEVLRSTKRFCFVS